MENEYLRYKISPEVITGDVRTVIVSGTSYGIISGMTSILSGGTNGESLLTDLTLPIPLFQTGIDYGYYDGFDGNVLQQDTVTNFLFVQTGQTYEVTVFNTSDMSQKKLLSESTYTIDWGDGSPIQTTSLIAPFGINHTYLQVPYTYTITLSQTNPWGITNVTKTVTVPYSLVPNPNPYGNVTFTPAGGSWANTPVSYDFIFWGDEENTIAQQVSSNFTTVPFYVTAQTKSQLTELALYGPQKYIVNQPIFSGVGAGATYVGVIFGIDPNGEYTGYTINNVDYYDFSNGTTILYAQSSGITSEMLVQSAITKNEYLLGVIDQPEIFSNVFIERGKESGNERIQRLGDVNSLGGLIKYGYKFFKIKKY
jgi:hypothetical protein